MPSSKLNEDLLLSLSRNLQDLQNDDNFAQLIMQCFTTFHNVPDLDKFFDLYERDGGKEFILDFITTNLNTEEYGPKYQGYMANLLRGKEYEIELLTDALSDDVFSKHNISILIDDIIRIAANNPNHYSSLVPIIKNHAETDFDVKESFQETCLDPCRKKEGKYIIEHLGFPTITTYPSLLTDDSMVSEVNSNILSILQKINTNFSGKNKSNLFNTLNQDLSKIITDNSTIAKLLTIAEKHVERIYITEKTDADLLLGGGIIAVYFPGNKNIVISMHAERVDRITEITEMLIHELTHCFIDKAYNNYSKPFFSNDKEASKLQTDLAQKMLNIIKEVAPSEEEFSDYIMNTNDRAGNAEFKLLVYWEEDWVSEIPAYFIEELAIRILVEKEESTLIKHQDSIMPIIENAIIMSDCRDALDSIIESVVELSCAGAEEQDYSTDF